jgi:hypothetical protein
MVRPFVRQCSERFLDSARVGTKYCSAPGTPSGYAPVMSSAQSESSLANLTTDVC